jgi:hypothetical protein
VTSKKPRIIGSNRSGVEEILWKWILSPNHDGGNERAKNRGETAN